MGSLFFRLFIVVSALLAGAVLTLKAGLEGHHHVLIIVGAPLAVFAVLGVVLLGRVVVLAERERRPR